MGCNTFPTPSRVLSVNKVFILVISSAKLCKRIELLMSLSLSMAVQNATIALTNPVLLRNELVVSLLGIPTNGAALMHLIIEFTGHVTGEAVHFRPES